MPVQVNHPGQPGFTSPNVLQPLTKGSATSKCASKSDTVILLDSTGSLKDMFLAEKSYAEKIIEQHYAKNPTGRLGLVVYSSDHRYKVYGLNSTANLREVIKSK